MLIDGNMQENYYSHNYTDDSVKSCKHLWSILDIHLKKAIFLFDSFVTVCFKSFIMQDNMNLIKEILEGLQVIKHTVKRITLIETIMPFYKNLIKSGKTKNPCETL